MSKIKALVVDDSRTMRNLIAAVLRSDPLIEIVGQCEDPIEARKAIKELNPDVITLDIDMPNMNGLDFLAKIMTLRPMPVVMVSALTTKQAEATIKALEIGAFECLSKAELNLPQNATRLIETVKAAAASRARFTPGAFPSNLNSKPGEYLSDGRVVAIGSSTGGVEALITVLTQFPKNCPPTVITQHMPANFTKSFAERLNRLCQPNVKEAENGDIINDGHIYVAPGGESHLEVSGTTVKRIRLVNADPVSGHRPSVDVMFSSIAKAYGPKAVGVILTGMGRDGANGLLEMKSSGAHTIGQNEETSLVYGMPKTAFDIGAVMRQYPLQNIGSKIISLTNRNNGEK